VKRIPELRELSEDHHHGLVLARKARQAAAGGDMHAVDEAWVEVELQFATELAPHFQIEESLIAPQLEAVGELELTKRLFEEHRALRAFVRPGVARTSADLLRFGELLEAHIRFEERELFEAAQKRLSSEALGAIAEACRANRVGR
jgi:hemerythrin-like domain-containing protein